MGPLLGEVYAYIQQCGQAPAGMPMSLSREGSRR